jgi:long-chain fatty acid transport protein
MIKGFLALCIFSLLTINVFAGGFELYVQGQKQIGMGGVGIALPQDNTCLFYNPGALTFCGGSQVYFGGSLIIPSISYLQPAPGSQTFTSQPQVFTPFELYLSFKSKKNPRLAGGLAVYTPFGSGLKWPDDWPGRFVIQEIELQSIFVQPTFSYQISDHFGIGLGGEYAFGSVLLRQSIPAADQNTNDFGEGQLKGNASGFGFNIGLYYKANDKISAGLTFRSSVTMKVSSGTATFTAPTAVDSLFPNTSFTTNLTLPASLNAGIAFKATEKFTISVDVNYVFWSSYDSLIFIYGKNTSLLQNTHTPRLYQNEPTFRLGGMYKFNDHWTVRAGAYYDLTPVRDGYVTPELPDANRISGSVGVSYYFNEKFEIDAASEFTTTVKRLGADNSANFSGTYQTKAIVPGIGFSYRF